LGKGFICRDGLLAVCVLHFVAPGWRLGDVCQLVFFYLNFAKKQGAEVD